MRVMVNSLVSKVAVKSLCQTKLKLSFHLLRKKNYLENNPRDYVFIN